MGRIPKEEVGISSQTACRKEEVTQGSRQFGHVDREISSKVIDWSLIIHEETSTNFVKYTLADHSGKKVFGLKLPPVKQTPYK